MLPISTRRRWMKRSLLAMGVVLAVVWLGSGWFTVRWGPSSSWAVYLSGGRWGQGTGVSMHEGSEWPIIERTQGFFGIEWMPMRVETFIVGSTVPETDVWWIPLWPVVAIPWVCFAVTARRDAKLAARNRTGKCLACGYVRAGIAPADPCPECGDTPASPVAST